MWIFALCLSILFMVHVQSRGYKPLTPISTDNPDVQEAIVNLTNKLRRLVKPSASNMLEVSWNKEAEKTAVRYSKTCAMEHSNSTERNITDCNCGENLFMSSYRASWTEVLLAFFNEYKDYNYTTNKGNYPKAVIGHYTQLVWYVSRWIGCAVSTCDHPKYKYFYVCHHCPTGNIVSHWPYKEGPPCGDCPHNCTNGLCTNPCEHQDDFLNCKDYMGLCDMMYEVDDGCKASCNCQGLIY